MSGHTAEKDRGCAWCGHAPHEGVECGEVVGYDHLNGDHECECFGARLTESERESLTDLLHSHLGFYISEDAESALAEWIEDRIIPPGAQADQPDTDQHNTRVTAPAVPQGVHHD